MIELDPDLDPRCVPLAWLLGRWEGAGVGEDPDPDVPSYRFGQELEIAHDGRPFLSYTSSSWVLDEDGRVLRPGPRETGFLRPVETGPAVGAPTPEVDAARPEPDAAPAGEAVPGGAPGGPAATASDDRHDTELLLAHPDGIVELYLGRRTGARLELATDAVVRTPGAPGRAAAQRLYGLVEGDLLWAWDAGAGAGLSSVMSARLRRVGAPPPVSPPPGIAGHP